MFGANVDINLIHLSRNPTTCCRIKRTICICMCVLQLRI